MIPPIRTRRQVTLAWHPYRSFTTDNVQTHAPLKSGVYKLAIHMKDGTLRVFYVGQATDLDSRLKEHLGQWESNEALRSMVERYQCSFSFAVVPLAQDRDAAERALYLHFRPSCNDQEPSGPAYIVTPLTTG
jgi:excinuclease UvrABC nuclease subunit